MAILPQCVYDLISRFKRGIKVNWDKHYSNHDAVDDVPTESENKRYYAIGKSYENVIQYLSKYCYKSPFKVYERTIKDETFMVFYDTHLSREINLILRKNIVVDCRVLVLHCDLIRRQKTEKVDVIAKTTGFYKDLITKLSSLDHTDPYFPKRYHFIHIIEKLLKNNHETYLYRCLYHVDPFDMIYYVFYDLNINNATKYITFIDKYIEFINLENKYEIYGSNTLTRCLLAEKDDRQITPTYIRKKPYNMTTKEIVKVNNYIFCDNSFIKTYNEYLRFLHKWSILVGNNVEIPEWIHPHIFDVSDILTSISAVDFLLTKYKSCFHLIMEEFEPYTNYINTINIFSNDFKKPIIIFNTLNKHLKSKTHKYKFAKLCADNKISLTRLYEFCIHLKNAPKIALDDILCYLLNPDTMDIVIDSIRTYNYTNIVKKYDPCPFWKSNSLILE